MCNDDWNIEILHCTTDFTQFLFSPQGGFEPGSKQYCCLWKLQSYCSNHTATTAGFFFKYYRVTIFLDDYFKSSFTLYYGEIVS